MNNTVAWAVTGTGNKIQIENGGTLTAGALVSCTVFQIDNGGTYIVAYANGTNGAAVDIPGSTAANRQFGASSTVEIQKWGDGTGGSPAALPSGVSWGNLKINVTTLGGSWQQGGNVTTINGNLSILATGGATRVFRFVSSQTITLNIGGDIIVSGGSLDLASSTGVVTANVGGNFNQTGGTFTSSGSAVATVTFAGGSASVTFAQSGGTFTDTNIDFTVASGKTLILNNDFPIATLRSLTVSGTLNCGTNSVTSAGAFTLSSGATMGIGSTDGINSGTSLGNIRVSGTRTFDPGANYNFNGSSAQVTGNGFPVIVNNFTVSNTAGVTLSANVTVDGVLALTNGDITTGLFTLFMGNGATSDPASTGDVVGNVNRSDLGSMAARSFGNPNVQITITAGSVTAMTVNLVKGSPSDFGNSVTRTYTLKDVVGTLVTATVRLRYLDSELNGNPETTLELWRKDGTSWGSQGADTRDSTNNWVEKALITGFSAWTIAGPAGPTDIAMVAYSANHGRDGKVLLQWETGEEVNNLGFNIYREEDGRRVRVNKSLIVGSGLMAKPGTVMTAGRSYLWRTSASKDKDSVYWIEEIDLSGRTVWHGPVYSQAPADGMMMTMSARQQAMADQTVTLEDLATEGAQSGATVPVQSADRRLKVTAANSTVQLGLASQAAVKITVKQEGWYRIGKPELLLAGLDPKADPRSLQLYADGVESPITVTTNHGKFDSTSGIEFYAVGLDTAETDQRVYWLISAKTAGKRIATVPGQGGLPSANSFLSTVERRDRSIYLSGIHNGDAENFFGTPVGNTAVDQTITLQHVDAAAAGRATIEVGMQGFSVTPHNVSVSLNGNPIGTIQYNNQTQGATEFTVPNNLLTEGQNVLTLVGQQGVLDVSLVDHIRVGYWHTYSADGNALKFTASANQQVKIGGFTTGDVKVFDVTNPSEPLQLAATVDQQDSGYAVTVEVVGNGNRTLVAIGADQVRSPLRLEANQPSTLRSSGNQADLMIITHGGLKDSFAQLAALRQSQGLKVAMVDVQDIYDEFNFGNKRSQAVKDFLSYARSNWARPPRYVLLAGSASYDPKNYNGLGGYDLVPTRMVDTEFMETASDDWFADFNLDGIPEMAVGRLPAHTPEEAASTVAKLVSYEATTPQKSVLLVADGNLGFNFEAANNKLAPLFPAGITVQQINRGQIGTGAAKQQLLDGIASGQKVVNYVGHGSPSVWRDNLLTAADALALTNTGRYPLFVAMTCLNGEFQRPELNTLAAALLNAPRGGAIAVWASSGFTGPNGQATMNQQFYKLLFQHDSQKPGAQALTLGDATVRAKSSVTDSDIRRTWILFGDPSMKLK
ncbi:MAG: C25 family cysteine peptidase [Acidobacteriota bacterium]